ncbi:siderophore-interacting protein [Dermabacteraceae bacterium P7074]
MSDPKRPTRPPKGQRPTHHLRILEKVWVTKDMVRIVAGGDEFSDILHNECTDAYVKLLFSHDGTPLTEPIDAETLRKERPAEEWPITRTYTLRQVDKEAQTLTIDLVTHGKTGVAGPWAKSCKVGDMVQFVGPGGAYYPRPETRWHAFVGDASALPAIARSLEALPKDAPGVALIEANSEEERIPLTHPEGIEIIWLKGNTGAGRTKEDTLLLSNALTEAIEQQLSADPDLTMADIAVFAHGEREAMKPIRKLASRLELPKENLSLSGYWAYGRIEQEFQAEKKLEIGKV